MLTIVGARPQFIKAAVVSRVIRNHPEIQEEIIHTGQHYDYGMSQIFFDEMDIPTPAANLSVGSGLHGATTAEMLKGLEAEILARKPDWVLVYGDTNSTLAGALAAAKLHVPIAHIEAGERSYNRKMPEEINRILTDHLSSLLFCCSRQSKNRLATEGKTDNVFAVGDVMYDAFLTYLPKAAWPTTLNRTVFPFALATLHRAQNTDEVARLESIFKALSALPLTVVLPLHPRTLKIVQTRGIRINANIKIVEPVSYFEMLGLLNTCSYVLTDSGGLQKEAYYAGKKCLVLRDETEWMELVHAGMNKITGIASENILAANTWAQEALTAPPHIYGDGKAGEKIVKHLLSY